MKATDLLTCFSRAGKRAHLIGSFDAGVVVALDMEGRLFTVLDGEVLNRVNPEAVLGESTQYHYLNPGGDGLWPAPEGTVMGYQYATGGWRVAPGLRMARYQINQATNHHACIQAEIDLVNNQGVGIPTLFSRQVILRESNHALEVQVTERITYQGHRPLSGEDCLLVPWSLCQFNCGPGCEVVFPCPQHSHVWDLYETPAGGQMKWKGGMCHLETSGSARYQVAMDRHVPWIEYRDPGRRLVIRRSAAQLPAVQPYIDIRDAGPDTLPDPRGVRYSVYSDTGHFMEIEAAGGCPELIHPGTELRLDVNTRFQQTVV